MDATATATASAEGDDGGARATLAAFFGEHRPVQEIAALMIRQYQMARQREGAAAATINRETSEHEILDLTWDEIDLAGGVIRLSPGRSKTQLGRLLPISLPLAAVLKRRRAKRRGRSGKVFSRDGVTVRAWRRAWPDACRLAGVPGRIMHDCRRTAARNLIRAGVPERVAMTLTGHKTRSVFDRYNIVNERELFSAGEQLVAYLRTKAGRNGRTKSATAPPLQSRGA